MNHKRQKGSCPPCDAYQKGYGGIALLLLNIGANVVWSTMKYGPERSEGPSKCEVYQHTEYMVYKRYSSLCFYLF